LTRRPHARTHDLAFARVALRERFYAQACFAAQQTAGKALKAIAYGLGERVVIGHSVVELVDRFAPKVAALASLREVAGVLDQYYVATRYPNGLPGGVPFEAFGAGQASAASEQAARFVSVAGDALGRD
jgi:HEPN domain-containing protein